MLSLLMIFLLFCACQGTLFDETILSEEAVKEILALEKTEKFRTANLNYPTYKSWTSLSVLQRALYLLDRSHLQNIKKEFLFLHELQYDIKVLNLDQGIAASTFLEAWADFTSEKQIDNMFRECDDDKDLKIDWIEYIICRSEFNQHGQPFDVSEFDYIENIIMMDFRERLNNPRDPMTIELLRRNEI
jgi:hypothetical protein